MLIKNRINQCNIQKIYFMEFRDNIKCISMVKFNENNFLRMTLFENQQQQ